MELATTTFHDNKKNLKPWMVLVGFSFHYQLPDSENGSRYFIRLIRAQESTHIWLAFGKQFSLGQVFMSSILFCITASWCLLTHTWAKFLRSDVLLMVLFTVCICWFVHLIFNIKDLNTLFFLQTAAENLINGLEEYIAESFVRTTSFTHKPYADYYSPSNVLRCVLDM